MNDYYLRTTDYSTLLALGAKLGVILLHYAEYDETEGENGEIIRAPIGEPVVMATDGGCFDFIGEIQRPTGELDAEDNPVMAPIADAEGVAYIHANLRTPHDIRAIAEASDDPVIQAALGQIAAFFVADELGNAVPPNMPHRVFA